MSMSSGLWVSTMPARIEASTTNVIQLAASQNRLPSRRVRLTGLTIAVSMPISSTAIADPGIEYGIEHIDDEVHQYETAGDEQHHTLQDNQVARVKRADQQPAEPRQGENRLDNQGA